MSEGIGIGGFALSLNDRRHAIQVDYSAMYGLLTDKERLDVQTALYNLASVIASLKKREESK